MTENIEVFKHNSIRIKAMCGNLYIDPFELEECPKDAACIFITHDHYDHFSPKDIEKAACADTILVVPEKMEAKARTVQDLVGKIVTVKPGTFHEIGGLEVETVPAYNIMKPFHPKKAGWVGYVLHVNGKRIYAAGDIDAIREAAAVKCDVALVPIGGFYTMDAKKAAELINAMHPSVAIPVHYGAIVGKPEDAEVFAQNVKAPIRTEIKIKF
ncbi:MAG: MBL fold metallo-hydrolase [Lachnospiraceae bacterium]|nr:MBL fold metallo-hydrolase [Lachnospiraceae bacterium]